jgi:hypothetical protein
LAILEVNGSSSDALIYKNKTDYTALVIGGDKLSRGLTLEGLLVNYYLRTANMYDALMQMGRWFGYREKYIDLMRVFTTTELISRFAHISLAEYKMREEFENLCRTPNATPRSFGLKILSHPEMTVSSPIKIRHGQEIRVSTDFSGQSADTLHFYQSNRDQNEKLVKTFIDDLYSSNAKFRFDDSKAIFENCDWKFVVNFLRAYHDDKDGKSSKWGDRAEYIEKMVKKKGELIDWSIAFRSNSSPDDEDISISEKIFPYKFESRFSDLKHPFARRLTLEHTDPCHIQSIGGQADDTISLTKKQLEEAAELTIKAVEERKRKRILSGVAAESEEIKNHSKYSARSLRKVRPKSNGLLQIYPVVFKKDSGKTKETGKSKKREKVFLISEELGVHWGFRVSFPGEATGESVDYIVNNVYSATMKNDQDEGASE